MAANSVQVRGKHCWASQSARHKPRMQVRVRSVAEKEARSNDMHHWRETEEGAARVKNGCGCGDVRGREQSADRAGLHVRIFCIVSRVTQGGGLGSFGCCIRGSREVPCVATLFVRSEERRATMAAHRARLERRVAPECPVQCVPRTELNVIGSPRGRGLAVRRAVCAQSREAGSSKGGEGCAEIERDSCVVPRITQQEDQTQGAPNVGRCKCKLRDVPAGCTGCTRRGVAVKNATLLLQARKLT